MRWVTNCLSAITAACIRMAFLNTASAISEDISDLKRLISVNEDTRMNSEALFLATHNYIAVPKEGYVNVNLDGKICKLVPNGDKPGLCDIPF